jgi:hypothetical protein
MAGQLKQRLQEVQHNHIGERTMLPCLAKDSYWIGIVLTFDDNGQLQYAECVDSVAQADFDVSTLQKEFSQVYPTILLKSIKLEENDNAKHDEKLLIDTLLRAVEENQYFHAENEDMENLNKKISNDDEVQNNETEVEFNPSNSSVMQGNCSVGQSNSESEMLGILNVLKSSVQVPLTEEKIDYDPKSILVSDASILGDRNAEITVESLRNLFEDLSRLLTCSERSLLRLSVYSSFQLADQTIRATCGMQVPEQLETEMSKEYDCLKKRLAVEEMNFIGIDTIMESCAVHLKNANWNAAMTLLKQLWKQACPLDIPELMRLVGKVENAAKLIKGKEVILFMGGSWSW